MGRVQVSTILAVYNGAATVARALDSALCQRFQGTSEIVVVDDGSTDATSDVLSAYREGIKIVRQRNRGLAAARNAGVAAAGGDFLAFLDADDVWKPERLAKTVAPLVNDPDVVLVFSDLIPADGNGVELASGYVRAGVAHAPSMEELLDRWWPILPSTVTMRRETFETCNGFWEQFKGANGFEDTWLWLLARERGRFDYVGEPLVVYRLTPFVERMRRYAPGFGVFARQMRRRWGAAGEAYIRRNAKALAWLLTLRGIRYVADGDIRGARRAMFCALRFRPRADAARRALATLLPRPNAQKMITRARSHPRTPLDGAILSGAIPVDLR